MELLAQPDLFESYDFNFLTTEIFHSQEKESDGTLTDGERMQLDWRGGTNDESDEPLIENQNSPMLGSENSEVEKNNMESLDDTSEAKLS